MKRLAWCVAIGLLGIPSLCSLGCNSQQEAAQNGVDKLDGKAGGQQAIKNGNGKASDDQVSDVNSKAPETIVEPLTAVPEVYLSEQHSKASKLKVGDEVPRLEFAMIDGRQQTLEELLGDEFSGLTVLAFWDSGNAYSEVQTIDLQLEFAAPLAGKPVKFISVAVDGTVDEAKAMVDATGATFPIVLDPEGEAFSKFATGEFLPRIYLLDTDRKIVWFDIGHSRDTRRNLQQAIDAKLGETTNE